MDNSLRQISSKELNKWFQSQNENTIVIDVREDLELEIAKFPFEYIHFPLSKVSLDLVNPHFQTFVNREIVVLCHMGVRSFRFCQWLLEHELVSQIWNLEGGIDGWSINVSSEIPRY